MSAPRGNKNRAKEEKGVQVNFYLAADEVAAIKRVLARSEEEVTTETIRRFAREKSKNGIWQAIKSELPPIII